MQDKRKSNGDPKFHENIWRVAGNQKILWREWEGDYVIFSSLSGETHTLDIASGKILRRIMERPSTIEDIRSEIADFLEVKNDAELGNAVDNILKSLEDAGLIEPEI